MQINFLQMGKHFVAINLFANDLKNETKQSQVEKIRISEIKN